MPHLIRRSAVVLVPASLVLAGCGGDRSDNPYANATPVGPDEAIQAAAADEFAACLRAADLPFEGITQEDGQKQVFEGDADGPMVYSFGDIGPNQTGEWVSDSERETIRELLKPYDPYQAAFLSGVRGTELAPLGYEADKAARYLIIKDTDYTDVWVKCLGQSGYTQPAYKMDPAEEVKGKQAEAQWTTKWAACARENGYPALADPVAPIAGDGRWPTAVLPAEITEAELNALLDV